MKINDAKIITPNQSIINTKKIRTSLYTEDYRQEHYNIPVEKLVKFNNQARTIFDEEKIRELANTIKEYGIRQPLTVVSSENKIGYYEIISGERRYKAALLNNLKTVPCIILSDRQKAREIAIIENIHREDLHPIELMHAYHSLLMQGHYISSQEIANKIGIAKSKVIEILNLRRLSQKTQSLLLNNNIVNRDFLRLLCKLNDDEQYKVVSDYIHKKNNDNKKILSKESQVLSLVLNNQECIIKKNNIHMLSKEQKISLSKILKDIIHTLYE